MVKGDLIEQVIKDTGRTDKRAEITTFVEWSQNEIVRAAAKKNYDLKDLRVIDSSITTVARQEVIIIPLNCRAILNLTLLDGANSGKIEYRPPRIYDKTVPWPQSSFGRPSIYTQKVIGRLHLALDVPDKVYRIRLFYSKWPAELVAVTSVPDLKNMDDLIIANATFRLYMSLGLVEKAMGWRSLANRLFGEVVASDRQKEDWHPVPVGFSFEPQQPLGEYWKNPFYKGG